MSFLSYRVKNMEAFKDGNVLGGRFIKPNEILVVSEEEFAKITNSGGILEILDTMIPNPKKESPEVVQAKIDQIAAQIEQLQAKEAEQAQAKEEIVRDEPVKRKPGRPTKKVAK